MSRARSGDANGGTWRLQDAKARFSEVVRLALQVGLQRVTVRGDAVVVVSSEEHGRLRHPERGVALVRAMADPRVRDIAMEGPKVTPSVRDVKL